MRFHVGFSFPIRKLLPFIGFLFVGCLAFFGIDKLTAHAWTTTNASGYDVHAYRPLYSNETDGTCSPSNYSGCTNQDQLYNATGCNNITKSGSTYCFFKNNNSTSYFSVKSMTCNNNSQCFAIANDTYGTNQTYRPRSMLVWKWKQTNVSWCTSGNIKLRFEMYLDSNNTVLNYTNLCAHNLGSITSSIGICSPLIKVNNSYYNGSNISSGTNTEQYEVTIPKPTTDLEIIVDDIQPFLAETGGEGGTYSNKTWNYGFRLVSYECSSSSSNQDTNALMNNDNQNTQSIINNQNNNTNNINQHIDNSAAAIVDSINDDSYNNNGQLGGLNGKFNEYGIDDLARAPLQLLSSIYNADSSTCQSLVLPISMGLSSASASIPCGTVFWSSFPSSVVGIYHTLVFGLSGWFIIKKLIKLIEDSLDPDDKSDMIKSL